MIGAQPEEIFFTSSGTESDHWAIWGARACAQLAAGDCQTPHIVTSAVEHPAVIQYLDALHQEVRRSSVYIGYVAYPVAYLVMHISSSQARVRLAPTLIDHDQVPPSLPILPKPPQCHATIAVTHD